jgi:hypothetical protein
MDLESDVYRSLRASHVVIGEASTTLFEAIGIVSRVVVWDTPKSRFYLGSHWFPTISRPEEIASHLDGLQPAAPTSGAEVWRAGWRAAFHAWATSRS